jgi:hypothetical protein
VYNNITSLYDTSIDLFPYTFQLCLVGLNRVRSSGLALSGNPID